MKAMQNHNGDANEMVSSGGQPQSGWLERLVRACIWLPRDTWRTMKGAPLPMPGDNKIVLVIVLIWCLPLVGAWLLSYWLISPIISAYYLLRYPEMARRIYGPNAELREPEARGKL